MKLKRIRSLALSGVLAVSMLTACGGGSSISSLLDNRTIFRQEFFSKNLHLIKTSALAFRQVRLWAFELLFSKLGFCFPTLVG